MGRVSLALWFSIVLAAVGICQSARVRRKKSEMVSQAAEAEILDVEDSMEAGEDSMMQHSPVRDVTLKLAPSFGNLTGNHVLETLDKELLVATITGTVQELSDLKDASWSNIVACMQRNAMIEPVIEKDDVAKADEYINQDIIREEDRAIIAEVETLFKQVISGGTDADVLDATSIDINAVAKFVASTGANIDSFGSLFAKPQVREKKMLDIAILRYPDIDNPHFMLYRIELRAWSDRKKKLGFSTGQSGFSVKFNSRKYKPRDEVSARLKQEAHANAVAEVEKMFNP